MTRAAPRHRINTVAAASSSLSWAWVTHAALVLALAVMVARATTTDALRDPWAVTPRGEAAFHGPGAATGLAFDLLAAVPALLVLARRAVDRDYHLAARRSHWLLGGLFVWAALSVGWSADKFAAVGTAAHLAAGGCLLWAASQLARSWDRFRVVAAVALGLSLALAAHTALYRLNDVAENRQYWAEHKAEFLKERNWPPDSFEAQQYERKLTTGEQSAFFNSANTLAAVGVLLGFAAAGLGVQRAVDDRDPRWLGLTAVAVVAGGWVLYVARSKTAAATPVLGVAVLGAYWLAGRPLRRWPVAAYVAGVGAVGLALAAVVAVGLGTGGLLPGHFSNSLDFRWKYWTAAAGVVRDHPLAGVGWGNFGGSYLAHRLPDAAEEIQDPHNFLVRFAAELGVVGLALVVGWLLWLAWELTRPSVAAVAAVAQPADGRVRVTSVVWVGGLAFLLAVVASMDFSVHLFDILVLCLRPVLLLAAVVLGGVAGAMRSPRDPAADGRPGPWVYATLVVGLGLFLLHNLIDFAWFEPGATCAFMTLAGAALGVAPAAPARPVGRPRAIGTAALGGVAWVAVAAGVVVPVALAASAVSAADDVIRSAPPDAGPTQAAAYRRAAAGYADAAALVPYDATLWTRAGRAAAFGGDVGRARSLIARAIDADPRLVEARLFDADLRAAAGDAAGVRTAYAAAVALAPRDVAIRLRYADAIAKLGDRTTAAAQYRAALANNDALPAGEPRRLPPADVARVRRLSGG